MEELNIPKNNLLAPPVLGSDIPNINVITVEGDTSSHRHVAVNYGMEF